MHTFRTKYGTIHYNSGGDGKAVIKHSGHEDTVEVDCSDLFEFVDLVRGRVAQCKQDDLP